MRVQFVFLLMSVILGLSGCGGGGGSSPSPTPSPAPAPTPTPNPTPGNVIISGHISFDRVPHASSGSGLNYNQITQRPVRGVRVQALSNNSVIEESVTNGAGNYSLIIPENTNVLIRVSAQILEPASTDWDVQVIDNTSSGALFVLDGSSVNSGTTNSTRNMNASSGWGGTGYTSERAAAPFAILDDIYTAMQFIRSVDSGIDFVPLKVNWSEDNRPSEGNVTQGLIMTSHFTSLGNQIYLLGKENLETDEYDSSVIVHEWGHFFVSNYSRSDSIGGPHTLGDSLDMRLAFNEAWATAMASMALADPVYHDTQGFQQNSGFQYSIGNNNVANPGWFSEGSIQSMLYDLFDASDDGADNVTLGFAPLYSVMVNEHRTSPFFTSIFTFITALKANNPVQAAAIDSLVASHNIQSASMTATGSGETNSAGLSEALPIYTNLVLNGSTINLCMSDTAGVKNKLGNTRFLTFTLPTQGGYRIEANRAPSGSIVGDPDFYIYQNGQLMQIGGTGDPDVETMTATLSAGSYVMSLREFNFTDDITPRDSASCYDVSLVTL